MIRISVLINRPKLPTLILRPLTSPRINIVRSLTIWDGSIPITQSAGFVVFIASEIEKCAGKGPEEMKEQIEC